MGGGEGVKDKYLKHERAGDQYVGQCVSGIKKLKKEFATSLLYFDFQSIFYQGKCLDQIMFEVTVVRPWVWHFQSV